MGNRVQQSEWTDPQRAELTSHSETSGLPARWHRGKPRLKPAQKYTTASYWLTLDYEVLVMSEVQLTWWAARVMSLQVVGGAGASRCVPQVAQ